MCLKGGFKMIKLSSIVISMSLLGAPAAFAEVDNSLCRELVSRTQNRYSVQIYNLTSRIDDLESQDDLSSDERDLLGRLVQMRDLAKALDADEFNTEVSRCTKK